MKLKLKFTKNFLFSLLSVAFMWLVWLIAYFCVNNEYVLPSIGATFSQMGKLLFTGGETARAFWTAFAHTLLRTFGAFAFSFFAGALLAVLALLQNWARAFLAPIVSVLRTVPTMAIILILLLWTSPAFAPVVVSVLVLLPAVYSAVLAALDEVTEGYGEMARSYRVGTGRKIFRMYLPLSLPSVLKQSGGIFSLGLKITVSGEVLASSYPGLGWLMQDAKLVPDMLPSLLALTVLTVLLGFLLEGVCALLYKCIVRWRA